MIKRQSFLQSAIILTLSMAIVKLIGAFFKLPLAYIINENGMGYFNTAYNFYAVFFSLATAGFPVAISKLVSENYSLGRYSDVRKIKSLSLPIFFFSGFIGMCVMLVSAKVYTQFIGNSGAFLPIIVLSPSILFCSLNSIYRGYHEGLRDMYPTAISQVIEALTKLLLGIYLAFAVTEHLTAEYMQSSSVLGKVLSADNAQLTIFSCAAAAAILGVSCGTLLSFLFLLFYHKIKGDGIENISYQKPHSDKHIRKRLLKIALPIAIGSMTVSISALVDQTIVQKRLGDLMIENSAEILELYKNQIPEENLSDISTIPNFLFGCHAYAMTIFMLIPALTQAFGTSALPNLSMYWAKNNLKAVQNSVRTILRITAIVALPIGLGITSISEPIVLLLYGENTAVEIISKTLAVLGVTGCFCALSIPITAMLQAIGKEKTPVKIMVVSIIIKIAINYYICVIPSINVLGASISSLVSHLIIFAFELYYLKKYTKIKINFKKVLIKPAFCAIICAVTSKITADFLIRAGMSNTVICSISIAVSAFVYLVFLILTQTIDKSDVKLLTKYKND